MLALEEKTRTVVLVSPSLVLAGKNAEIVAKLEENYLEVKAKKQVYLAAADAAGFLLDLPLSRRSAAGEEWAKGLTEVVVVEHLDNDAVERAVAFVSALKEEHGEESLYCSESKWASMRDLEFFFPHQDATVVERTLVVIKPDGVAKGAISGVTLEESAKSAFAAAGLFVVGSVKKALSEAQAEVLCEEYKGTEAHKGSIGVLLQEPGVIAMCVEGRGAIGKCQLLAGPTHAGVAKERAPTSLRAVWGTDGTSNALHVSSTLAASEAELKAIFPEGALQMQRTLCVVKPHAMGSVLQIRMEIEEAGFTILREKHTVLTEARAKEFYANFAGEPGFGSMIQEVTAGPCAVLVLCRLQAVDVWQQLMGPANMRDAKRLRPNSVRARYGADGQRNAVHGSATAKAAAWEVRFFCPELGPDPVPDDDEVRDYLLRKSATASMDLKTMSSADATDYTLDPTLQQLISSGLLALCQVRPKGVGAVSWFKDWLVQNSPNAPATKPESFDPPERTKRIVEYGVNQDGLAFSVEAPAPAPEKKVIDVDVSEEEPSPAFSTPPFVVSVLSSPGVDVSALCAKLSEEFMFVHLDATQMMNEEVAAGTRVGTEIMKHLEKKEPVADALVLKLLKEALLKGQDKNRFLISGFSRTLAQTQLFEQEVATIAFTLCLEGTEQSLPAEMKEVSAYYAPIGKVRTVSLDQEESSVYASARKFFLCRFIYLCGPPGAPMAKVAAKLQAEYGYSAIDLNALLHTYAKSEEKDAEKVRVALAKGKPIEASIACPLVLTEVYRDLAQGVQNFVFCDFPQSVKQAEFLELRVPCTTKPLLFDFTQADAEDMVATMGGGMEAEMKTAAYFGKECQDMLGGLSGLTRLPISLAEIDSLAHGEGPSTAEGLELQVLDAMWKKAAEKVMPSLTLVLGLPCSGTDILAPMLAGKTANTYAVDCDQLLDKEMERKTAPGSAMQSMLSSGQVIPLSTTIALLNAVVNTTCSDALVLENCPLYEDQIGELSRFFKIDKVFYVAGDDKAVSSWKEKYVAAAGGEGGAKAFNERVARLSQIVDHFSRQGMINRLEVPEATVTEDMLKTLVVQATLPQLFLVTGLSSKLTPALAGKIAAQLGAGEPVGADAAPDGAEAAFARLCSGGAPALVLDRYLAGEDITQEFLNYFGVPKMVINVVTDEESLLEDFKADHEDMEEEAVTAAMASERAAQEAVLKVFQERCPGSVMTLDKAAMTAAPEEPMKAVEQMFAIVKSKLMPEVYVVCAPGGEANLAVKATDLICSAARSSAGRPLGLTVIDAMELFTLGKHSPRLEELLHQASFTASAPDCLDTQLWTELFAEAFATAARPMGPFLVTNFPTPSALSGGPAIRDQFCMLESVSSLAGVIHVRLEDEAFAALCSKRPEDLAAYQALDAEVQDQTSKQFDKSMICECSIGGSNVEKAAKQVCDAFQAYISKAE